MVESPSKTSLSKHDSSVRVSPTESGAPGFTLLELIITVSLLAIVTVLVAGALRVGIRAWEKGSQTTENIQSSRVVMELLKRQIGSALPYEVKSEGKTYPAFIGEENQLQFVSVFRLFQKDDMDSVLVAYRVTGEKGKRNLEVIEKRMESVDFLDPARVAESENWRFLCENITDFLFEYAGESGSGEEIVWEPLWDSKEKKTLPLAVKLTLETDTMPIELIVRFPVKNVWASVTP